MHAALTVMLALLGEAGSPWTRSTERDPDRPGRRHVPLTPSHAASLNVMWEDESWGRFGIEAYYTGRHAAPTAGGPWMPGRPSRDSS